MGNEGNVIIFSDFSVFSTFSKNVTLDIIRKSSLLLNTYNDELSNRAEVERILIHLSSDSYSPISNLFISTYYSRNETIEYLGLIEFLLDCDKINFFSPSK